MKIPLSDDTMVNQVTNWLINFNDFSLFRNHQLLSYSRISKHFFLTQRFITAFARARHWSLSWARSVQSISLQPISLRYILLLSSHLRLSLPSDILHSGFHIKILYELFSPIRAICPAQLIPLDFITLIRLIFSVLSHWCITLHPYFRL
jgi:hypothetical protein